MRIGSWLIACLALGCASAAADCSYPKAPQSIPDGSTASQAEMLSAMTLFKQYNADVTAYLACLGTETSDKVRGAGSAATTILQIKSLQSKKHNAAVDELQAMTTKFNSQVRAFKSRS